MIIPRYISEISYGSFFDLRGIRRYYKLNKEYPFIYDSGTSALYVALKNLNLSKDTTVGVPLYSCSSVWQAVYKAGYKIKFLDIGISSNGYSYDINEFNKVDVLVFIHYFGFLNTEVEKIKVDKPCLLMIDDMTHVPIYSKILKTNMAIYSFNFHKPIAVGAGGILKIHNETIKNSIEQQYIGLAEEKLIPSFKKFIKTFLKNSIYFPTIYTLLYKQIIKNKKNDFIAPDLNIQIMPKKLHFLFKMLMGNQVEHSNSSEYTVNYKRLPRYLILPVTNTDILSYFPIFAKNKQHKSKILIILEEMDIDYFLLWQNSLKNAVYYGLKEIDKYKATQNILEHIIFLPQLLFANKNQLILSNLLKEIS